MRPYTDPRDYLRISDGYLIQTRQNRYQGLSQCELESRQRKQAHSKKPASRVQRPRAARSVLVYGSGRFDSLEEFARVFGIKVYLEKATLRAGMYRGIALYWQAEGIREGGRV